MEKLAQHNCLNILQLKSKVLHRNEQKKDEKFSIYFMTASYN